MFQDILGYLVLNRRRPIKLKVCTTIKSNKMLAIHACVSTANANIFLSIWFSRSLYYRESSSTYTEGWAFFYSAACSHEMAANAQSSPIRFSLTICARSNSYNPPQVEKEPLNRSMDPQLIPYIDMMDVIIEVHTSLLALNYIHVYPYMSILFDKVLLCKRNIKGTGTSSLFCK